MFGQDEANHGTERYRVGDDGLVRVPAEAAVFLTNKGGFVVAQPIAEGPVLGASQGEREGGMLKLHHGDASGCSFAGREYPSDARGDVLVPAEAAAELMSHGFEPVPGASPARKPVRPAPRTRSRKG
jgi:hypothetical protein